MADDVRPIVVVTGANGFVGARVCQKLVQRSASVRAVVRRSGTAPALDGIEERVGDFGEHAFAAEVVGGADAVVSTVHPMGSDRRTQQRIGVEATRTFALAARDAGVATLIHVSTAAVYLRTPGTGDVSEESELVGDDANDYSVTKRDADAALTAVEGITRVAVRPPAILGPGETSVWNTLRPRGMLDDEAARHAAPDATFAWVHVDDLAALIADLATGRVAPSDDPATRTGDRWLDRGQRRRGPGDAARLLRDGDARAGRRGGLGRGPGLDGLDRRRPRPRLGLDAHRHARCRPSRDRHRPSELTAGNRLRKLLHLCTSKSRSRDR